MSAALLSGFLALLYGLDHYELAPSVLRVVPGPARLVVYGVVAAAAFGCAVAPGAWRRAILLGAAVIAAPLVFGAWSVVWFGYVAVVIAVARAPVPVVVRLVVAVATWAAVPVARVAWLDGDAQADTILLSIVWGGQLYAALYLVVERERELAERRSTVLADAFYLLALPRLVVPFFQPISPSQLARSERSAAMPARMIWRGAGLAAYAAGVAVFAWTVGPLARLIDVWPLALAVRFVALYAHATYTIFTAIAMFRLLGFYLPSGYRTPFLSSSFAEFFRRYNYYVRDAVLSLFYFPLLGRLRHSLPPRAATIVSAYVAIVMGSFLLHDILVPMATTIEPSSTIGYFLDPVRVAGFVVLWTLIIVPTVGFAPRRAVARTRTRTILAVAAFNVAYFALWYVQDVGRGRG